VPHFEKNRHPNKKTSAGRVAGAALFASVATSVTAFAEDGPPDTDKLADVVVTAQKRTERLQEVPVPVAVLNTDELSTNGTVLLRDYYTSVPGLAVTPNIEGSQMLAIRGITTGGFGIPTVGVMIDEVPFGGSTSGGNNVPDIDPGDLERVEVLRGPQGTLYGANSMGGLIKYVTKDPSTERFSGRFEAGADTVYNGKHPGSSFRASANVPVSDAFAFRVSGFVRNDAGYIDNPVLNTQGVNEAHAYGTRLAGLWSPLPNFSVKLTALYQETKADGLSEVVVQPPLGDLQQNYAAGVSHLDSIVQAYSAVIKAEFAGIDFTSVTGYNSNHSNTPFDFSAVFAPAVKALYGASSSPLYTRVDVHKLTQELRASGSIGPHFDWLLGGYYTYEHDPFLQELDAADPTGHILALFYYRAVPATFQETAGFGDLTYHVNDQFDIQVGVRRSHSLETDTQYQDGQFVPVILQETAPNSLSGTTSGNAFTYLLTPRFKISSDLMVYARLASGYRPGGTNGFSPGAPPTFNPDKTYSYEAGTKASFLDNRLSVDASVYYTSWKNLQIQLFNLYSYQTNGSSAKSEGVELTVEAKPVKGLSVSGFVSYDNAVLTRDFPPASTAYGLAGDRLPNTPRFSGNISLEQNFPVTDVLTGFVGAELTYVGRRDGLFTASPTRQTYDKYTRTDLRAGVNYESWTVNLYVNNVADVRGVTSGGLGYYIPTAFTYIQPRTIGLSVSRPF
jgi:iron complex outermembrane recepter protein